MAGFAHPTPVGFGSFGALGGSMPWTVSQQGLQQLQTVPQQIQQLQLLQHYQLQQIQQLLQVLPQQIQQLQQWIQFMPQQITALVQQVLAQGPLGAPGLVGINPLQSQGIGVPFQTLYQSSPLTQPGQPGYVM